MDKKNLAVYQYKEKIIESVTNNPVTVIEAPTGSGKTTQIPQIIFNSGLNGWGIIGVTQPRRIAAYGVSKRIAEEMNTELGRLVGYKMRFDDCTDENTRIKIMTDGILLEELRSDPLLSRYSVIMIDEAHERSLNIDFIIGLIKQLLKIRNDLKVVVSSATINAKLFSNFFNNAPIISVKTKPYPVEINYIPIKQSYDSEIVLETISNIIIDLEDNNINGDVLIFLNGENQIKTCCERLSYIAKINEYNIKVLPLYARLSHEEQKKVFLEYSGFRKIVVATNIAETSITIDGIIHVVDPGSSKLNYYNPRTFTSFLETKPISKASCNQRMGRAGRTAPGFVYRLYSERDFEERDEFTLEEIYRTDLSEVVLRMADLGISHYSEFEFIAPPKDGAINSAIETLMLINALNENQELTDLGRKMVDFPLEPRLSRILLEAVQKYSDVTNNVIIIISFLSAKTPFLYPLGEEIESRKAQKKLYKEGGDFFTWINLYYKYKKSINKEVFCKKYYIDLRTMNEIINIHSQLTDMLIEKNYNIKYDFNYNDIIKCVCSGLKQYICKKSIKKKNTYYSVTEKDIRIHPGSFLFGNAPEWIVGGEIVNTGRTYVRSSSMVPEKIIKVTFSDVYISITKRLNSKNKTAIKEIRTVKRSVSTNVTSSNKIYIFDKYFEIKEDKKGKYLYVPYHIIIQLKNKKKKIIEKEFSNIKSKLIFKEKIILIDRFNSLLKYFDKIDLDNGLNLKWPRNQTFIYPDDWNQIFKYIKLLLKPTLQRKKSIKTGFLTFDSSEDNTFFYYLEKDFFNSIETSLNTMEKLFDSEIIAWNDNEKIVIEHIHHKLSTLAEEMEV